MLTAKRESRATIEKQVSLTVLPQEPGSQDIHVEIKHKLTAKKRKSQRRFAAFLLIMSFLMLFPMARNLLLYLKMNEDYAQLLDSHQELVLTKETLEEERDMLHSREMIERLAREELDMVMPGESKVYQAIPTGDMPQREGLRSGEALH